MSADYLQSSDVLDAVEAVEAYLELHFRHRQSAIEKLSPQLFESVHYSLFSGGKRFRPALCLATFANAVPWAAAVEMVHTYSLIHDDLPCMDNDDLRRGKPTNHKKYGEALALLAGDGLLTESFLLISEAYREKPAVAIELVALLARAAGLSGMVGGQAMDMELGLALNSPVAVETVHLNKTAELISICIEGAAVVEGASRETQQLLREIGLALGLCFQIKDDILDGEQDKTAKSFLFYLSLQETTALLQRKTQEGLEKLGTLPLAYHELSPFFHYNLERIK